MQDREQQDEHRRRQGELLLAAIQDHERRRREGLAPLYEALEAVTRRHNQEEER